MNEPSVFNGPEGTIPKGNLHFKIDGTPVQHRDVHNTYGLMMSKATYDGMVARDEGVFRPFILTRSAFFGSQKYSAKWTGDNRANFAELDVSISQLMSLGIAGVPFVGPDVPGFYGNPEKDIFKLYY